LKVDSNAEVVEEQAPKTEEEKAEGKTDTVEEKEVAVEKVRWMFETQQGK
jgi:hypothetical protein